MYLSGVYMFNTISVQFFNVPVRTVYTTILSHIRMPKSWQIHDPRCQRAAAFGTPGAHGQSGTAPGDATAAPIRQISLLC